MRSWSVRGWIHLLGAVALVAHLSMTLLSYVQAPTLWHGNHAPHAQAFFEALAGWFSIAPVPRFSDGNAAVFATGFPPLAVACIVALIVVLLLIRHRRPPDAAIPQLLFHWALAFGAASFLAFPVFTQDFWLSMAWGRMIAAGINPYYAVFTPDSLAGLPLDHFPMVMSYGPLWGLVSGGVMTLAGGSVLVAAILFKLLLGAAWVGALVLIDRIARDRGVLERCLAIVVFGWTPLSANQTLAEGHNDIVMVWLVLLWLYLLLRRHWWTSPVALIASALCKFTTLPLFLLDAAFSIRRDGMGMSTVRAVAWYMVRLILPAVVALAVFVLFYRSFRFFDGINVISEWQFLRPQDALEAIEDPLGIPMWPLQWAVIAFFPAVALYWLGATVRFFSVEHVLRANLAIMAAVLFSAVPHIWSWYLVWVLAPAALLPAWWLSRFVMGTAIMTPFTVICWWFESLADQREPAAFAVYAGALLWTLATRPQSIVDAGAAVPAAPPTTGDVGACGGSDR